MKKTATIARIENTNPGIYRCTFPEYEEVPEFVDQSLQEVVDAAPVYLCTYILLNNSGEFPPHRCSIKDFIKNEENAYYTVISCDTALVEENFFENKVSADAFFTWCQEHSEEILKGKKNVEDNKNEEESDKNSKGLDEIVSEAKREKNDVTYTMGEIFDDDTESNVFETKNVKKNTKNDKKSKNKS